MKLIEKNTFGDDTFYILEMDAQDKEAISEHIGDVNGNYIMYNGLSAINDSTLAYPRIGHLWAEIRLEDTYQTIGVKTFCFYVLLHHLHMLLYY